jgi:membrane protein
MGRIYDRANRLTGGIVGIVRDAFGRFGEARGSQAAAGMAYYAVFSLFPLLLALIIGGTYLLNLEQAAVRAQVLDIIAEAIPVSRELIARNINQVLAARGTVGLIGVLGALWSGSGVFTILSTHITRAWPESPPRGLVRQRLVAFGMVGTLVILLVASIIAGTVLDLMPEFELPLVERAVYDTFLWPMLSDVLPWLLMLALFVGLYRWVPNTQVPWSAAFWSALVVALFWELAARGFGFYLRSGLAQYELVYGSLGTVVALMFWAYLASWITIFGAHLGAAIAGRPRAGEGDERGRDGGVGAERLTAAKGGGS